MTKQLDLLSWTPPRQVIPFPCEKRIGKVRRVAEVLEGKHGKAADAYWRQTVDALVGPMERAGIPTETIRAEVRAFHDAVQRELVRRAHAGRPSPRTGGDAA